MKKLSFLVVWVVLGGCAFFALAEPACAEQPLPVGEKDFPFLVGGVKPDQFGKTGRLDIIDADTVKVWLTTIRPNVPLQYHRHLTGRLIIPMQDMQLTKNYDAKSGRKPEIMVWKRGQAYYYDADEIGVYHNDENAGTQPMQVMVVAFRNKRSDAVLEVMPGK